MPLSAAYSVHPVPFLLPQEKIRTDLIDYPSNSSSPRKRRDAKDVVRKNGRRTVKPVKWLLVLL
jgi:hypothetical protein